MQRATSRQMMHWWRRIGLSWVIGIALLDGLQILQAQLNLAQTPSMAWMQFLVVLGNVVWYATLALGLQAIVACNQATFVKSEQFAAPYFSPRARFVAGLIHSLPALLLPIINQLSLSLALRDPAYQMGLGDSVGIILVQIILLGCLVAAAPRYAKFAYWLVAVQFAGVVATSVLKVLVITAGHTRPADYTWLAPLWSLAVLALLLKGIRIGAPKLASAGFWLLTGSLLLQRPLDFLGTFPLSNPRGWLGNLCWGVSSLFYTAPSTASGFVWIAISASIAWFWFLRPLKGGRPLVEVVQHEEQEPAPLLQ